MLQIPYERNPNHACALACATMVARYYFPETTWDNVAGIVGWQPGYVVWMFKFWLWIMDKGIRVTDFDLINYEAWAIKGLEGLKASVPEKEFAFYLEHTKDLNTYTEDIQKLLKHKNFIQHHRKPSFVDLKSAFRSGAVCEAVLDSKTLDSEPGFSLHRVVILDVTDREVVFHDPRKEPRPARRESREHFEHAWLGATQAPELCIYQQL